MSVAGWIVRTRRAATALAAVLGLTAALITGASAQVAGVSGAQTPAPGDAVRLVQSLPSQSTVPRRCPLGTVGRFPNCKRIPPPQVRRCPKGTVGRYPNCRKIVRPKCPRGTVGKWPACVKVVRPRCPKGTYGRWPNCRKRVAKRCPRGFVGTYPNCRRLVKQPKPVCPRGTRGRWPKCTKVVTPKRPGAKPPRRIAPRPPRTQPPRRVVTLPNDRRPDEIVVLLDQAQAGNVEFAIAQQYRLVRLQGESNQLLQARVQRYRIPDTRTPADVIAAMQGDPRVAGAQPNYLYRLEGGKGKARRARGSMHAMQYAPANMQLGPAHKLATGRRAIVAVIDSGIDRSHPELAEAVAGAFNAVGDRAPKPDAHGTAIAGIIGARARLLGVAPGVRLLAARAFFRERGGGPLTTTFILLRAVDWSFANKARVFNLSFTGPEDRALRTILETAHDRGAILIAAAGNAGAGAPAAYPAAYPHVLAITALDKASRLYKKANRGGYVAAAAPGVDVLVAVPRGGYDVKSGTSFAAAHISGLAALMLERNPALTAAEVHDHIAAAAHDLGPKGRDALFGAGRANALGALEAVIGAGTPAPLTAGARPDAQPAASRR